MRYVAAYILAVMGGNASPSAADLTEILGSVGVEVDSAQLDIVIKVRLETSSIFLNHHLPRNWHEKFTIKGVSGLLL